VIGWTYDNAGNLTNDGTTSYTYDPLNRLPARGSTSFAYNGDGTLVRSGTTNYTQDLATPLSQILGDGTNTYVYGLERLYGTTGTRTWYLSDPLGSVRATLSDIGFVGSVANYDPYGSVQSGAVGSFGFTGELQQGSSVYLRARWYNAAASTFTTFRWQTEESNDYRPASHHPYIYALNNPVSLTDPSGRDPWWNDDVDARPCPSGQFRDEAGRCVYYKEWHDPVVDGATGGKAAPPDFTEPLIFTNEVSPPAPQIFTPRGEDGDILVFTNPALPWGSLVFDPPMALADILIFGDCWEFDELFPNYVTNDGGKKGRDGLTPEEEVMVREAERAQRRVGVTYDVTIAEVAGKRVHSGWKKRWGYEQKTDDVFDRAEEIGFVLPANKNDQGVVGRWAASHAEKQAYEVAPGKPIGVSRDMCGADSGQCIGYFRHLSIFYQQTNVVADPYTVRIFRSDGSIKVIENSNNRP
jgi:RHS repeat-associated protein